MSVTLERKKTPHDRLGEIIETLEVRGLFAQIGLGHGESARTILDKIPSDKKLVIIDPYGSIGMRTIHADKLGYPDSWLARDNDFSVEVLSKLYLWSYQQKKHFLFYPMEDVEFFERFQTGIFYYNESEKVRINEYGFVYFNANTRIGDLVEGIRFMNERTPKDGVWVFNNIQNYTSRQKEMLSSLMEECNMRADWESDFLVATKLVEPLDCLEPKQEAYAETDKTLIANIPSDTDITYH